VESSRWSFVSLVSVILVVLGDWSLAFSLDRRRLISETNSFALSVTNWGVKRWSMEPPETNAAIAAAEGVLAVGRAVGSNLTRFGEEWLVDADITL